jgi:hypothetical protein
MNRKLDVIQEVIFELPKKILSKKKKKVDMYKPLLDAVKVFARTEKAALIVVDVRKKKVLEEIGISLFKGFTGKSLLDTKKAYWSDDDEKVLVVRSPYAAGGKHVFFILEKITNYSEDMEYLQILAAQALLLAVQGDQSQSHES